MPRSTNPTTASVLLMVLYAALLAATTLLAKVLGRGLEGVVVGPGLHPLQISAGRFCFAFLLLLPLVVWRRPALRALTWPLHLGRSVAGWAGVSCLFAAAGAMRLADATAISFLSPLVTMVLAIPLLGERVGPWRWSAAVVALAGALLLIRPGTDAFQAAGLIALAAALFIGIESVLIKCLSGGEPTMRILIVNNAIGSVVAVGAASFVWQSPSVEQWLLLLLLGGTMLAAQASFIAALRLVDASFAVPFLYATLVFAALYDLAVFSELPDAVSFAGAGLIVGGALLLAWRERR